MELIYAKYISMFVLLVSNLLMTLLAIYLQRFLKQRTDNVLSITQRIISCLTSGILLGTLLMLILPVSLDYIDHHSNDPHSHSHHSGYLFVGLGFFLICIIEEITRLYERYTSKEEEEVKTEDDQLINTPTCSSHCTRLITMVFALGVHYFFQGVIIGGQTKATTIWILLGAICLHMSLLAFSVAIRLLIDNAKSSRVFLAMFCWSIMGPVGVLLTLFISSNASELNGVHGILQCISAGTFIYVTFIHMIHDDLMKTKTYPFLNIFLIFVGFLIIAFISFGHEHGG